MREFDSGNLLRSWHLRSGDIAGRLPRAAVVVENTYRTPFVDHAHMETERDRLDRR
jgi:CO/xanthine dehydrogenase Mo-binding subunit